jgi:predicted metalloprotease with PDZ domain
MLALWRDAPRGGDQGEGANRGVTEELILATVARLGGKALAAELRQWVHERAPLELLPALAKFGVEPESEALNLATELGIKVAEGPITGVQVKSVLDGGPGAAAGLSAGDEILAVDGWRVRRLDETTGWLRTGDACELLVVRRQRVRTLKVAARDATQRTQATPTGLKLAAAPNAQARARRAAWLGQ